MASDDVFKRKSLLPEGACQPPESGNGESRDSGSPAGDVFSRKTLPPSASAELLLQEAKQQSERDAALRASEPRDSERPTDVQQAPEPLSTHATPVVPSGEFPELELDFEDGALGFVDGLSRPAQLPPEPPPQAPEEPSPEPAPRGKSLSELYATHDFSGTLELAEQRLSKQPQDKLALKYAERCRESLTQIYLNRLGTTEGVLIVQVPPSEIRWLSMNHRAGFVLSLVDGSSSIEEIIDVSGMPRFEVLRTMVDLLERGVIGLCHEIADN